MPQSASHGLPGSILTLQWPPAVAIATCGLLGVLLPAFVGLRHGMPEPGVHDEFAYLLNADTFAQGRLTNPSPPFPEFFEAPHVLVTPSYASKYPPGQGAIMALGQRVAGHPIWGVWFSCGLFAAGLCWMLQAWTSRAWALAITGAAIALLGVNSYWAQSYWGGMMAACGAALLLGAMRRTLKAPSVTASITGAFGIVLLANTRPFEGLLLCMPTAAVLSWWLFGSRDIPFRRKAVAFVLPMSIVLMAGAALMGVYNRAVTGHWLQAPYALHHRQYFAQDVYYFSGIRAPERVPLPRVAAFYETSRRVPERGMRLLQRMAVNVYERLPATLGTALGVLQIPASGALFWLAALMCVGWWGGWLWFCAATVLVVVLGQSLVAWWHPHYVAPLVPVVFAAAGMTLHRIEQHLRAGGSADVGVAPLAVAVLAAGYLAVPFVVNRLPQDAPTTADAVAAAARPTSYLSRAQVKKELEALGGFHLALVTYGADFSTQRGEWVYNPADLDTAPVVFAHDLGPGRNDALIAAYPGRSVWAITVTEDRVVVTPYGP